MQQEDDETSDAVNEITKLYESFASSEESTSRRSEIKNLVRESVELTNSILSSTDFETSLEQQYKQLKLLDKLQSKIEQSKLLHQQRSKKKIAKQKDIHPIQLPSKNIILEEQEDIHSHHASEKLSIQEYNILNTLQKLLQKIHLEKRIPQQTKNSNRMREELKFEESVESVNSTYVSEYQFAEPKHFKNEKSFVNQEKQSFNSFAHEKDMKNWSGEYSNLLFPRPTKPFQRGELSHRTKHNITKQPILIPKSSVTESNLINQVVEVNESFVLPPPNIKKIKKTLQKDTKKNSDNVPVKGRVATLSGVKNNPKMFSQNSAIAGGVLK